jgi:hypothetical protein
MTNLHEPFFNGIIRHRRIFEILKSKKGDGGI